MEDFFFIIFFLLMPCIWLILLRFADIKISYISIPSFLIIFIFIKQYIGYPVIFFFLDDYRSSYFIDRDIMWLMFACSSYTITFLIIGFIFARNRFGILDNSFQNEIFQNKSPKYPKFENKLTIILFIISLYVLYIYLSRVGFDNLALFQLIGSTDNGNTAYFLRSKMGNDFSGKHHWYRIFFKDFLSISSYALLASFLITKKKFVFLVFLISFLASSFSLLVSTAKAPILMYYIGLCIVFFILKKNSKLNQRFVYFVLIVILILTTLQVYFIEGVNYSVFDTFKTTLSRITVGQMSGLYYYLSLFPDEINFLNGRSFPNPGGILPFEPFNLTQEVMKIASPSDIEQGIVGSMPTFFWGEMYANFGYFGIIIPPIIVGYLLYWLNIIFFRVLMTPLILGLYVWSILHYQILSSSSLSDFIIDIDTFLIVFVVIFIVSFSQRGKIKIIKK